ncbi:MarR family winged helix-turn-helix transcriptional regulator [Streptacidiphilus jiangxiensis]|uniref:DNA-binding transcriptional regulator, MarR family n=1 Tax=Streptacidiphilus jiangxiensis TaxID=235985 RepID=A0A1H7U6T6_STRJI|nr:MarR family transcriptional regulator [Streptacidiphilus jiangxiensis]SEL92514.1 DNA-binding transcriptional regulator, MarR family [Streptacidiphilus jiangxiensis]
MDARDALNQSTATAIRVAVGMIKRRTREVVDGQLTTPEWSTLAQIARSGPCTVAGLAREQQITPQAMGSTVASLEKHGLVTRSADPDDRRRSLLTVSDTGAAALRSGRDALSDRMAAALGESFTDAEVATLAAAAPLLERLAQHF